MSKYFILILSISLLLTGCSNLKKEDPPIKTENPMIQVSKSGSEIEVIGTNLNIPWSISKHNQIFYLSEREGTIAKIENEEVSRQQVELKKELATAKEAGLLGFVLSPDFSQSNEAIAYYTYVDNSKQFNRIVTLKLDNNRWREDKLLLDKIPSGRVHHGGRLEIGPDGKLYATAGDALESSIAQDKLSLGGKILRLNLDGSIPTDNPFPNSYVYSYGHRNPQGITWSSDGVIYASEHGNSANDEINKIEAGKNYGWPIIEGQEKQDGMVTPLFTSGTNKTWAPSGMDYYNGKVYVATLTGNSVLEFNLATNEQHEIITGLGRIRDVFVEGDVMYFISNNTDGRGQPKENDDKLYRIKLN